MDLSVHGRLTALSYSLVRASALHTTPWSNGAGTTTRLWTAADASWTLSIAVLDEDADFSVFPDHDRQLMALGENPVGLLVDGTRHVLRHADVLRFRGDAAARGRTTGDGSRALNLMTLRERASGSLDHHRMHGRTVLRPTRLTALVLLTGRLRLPDGTVCTRGDTVVLGDEPITVTADRAALGRIRITRTPTNRTDRQRERTIP